MHHNISYIYIIRELINGPTAFIPSRTVTGCCRWLIHFPYNSRTKRIVLIVRLTHFGYVMLKSVSKLIIKKTLKNMDRTWNFIVKSNVLCSKMHHQNVSCKMEAILFRPQYINNTSLNWKSNRNFCCWYYSFEPGQVTLSFIWLIIFILVISDKVHQQRKHRNMIW